MKSATFLSIIFLLIVAAFAESSGNAEVEEEYNPCAATSCPVNSTCEVIPGVRPPQARCKLFEASNPCDTVDCPENTRCKLNQVQCFTTPCPPISECVPLTRPSRSPRIDKCSTVRCTANTRCIDGRCVPIIRPRPSRQSDDQPITCANVDCRSGMICKMEQVTCIRAPCHPIPTCVEPKKPRVAREIDPNEDPCSTIRCRSGTECNVIMPSCIEGSTDCGPKGVCVPTSSPQSSPMPLARDDPITDIQNKFCMMARCAHGCITIGIKCNDDGTECEYLGRCAPENLDVSTIKVCENSTCPKNKVCEEEVVQCFAPPCLPIPKCK